MATRALRGRRARVEFCSGIRAVESGIKLVDEQVKKLRTKKVKVGKKYETKVLPGPQAQVAMVVMDPHTGAVLALVGGRDYGRVDVMVRPGGEPVVLEVNTLPGMTETSLLPKAAAAAGILFADLCQRMIDLAMQRAPTTAC